MRDFAKGLNSHVAIRVPALECKVKLWALEACTYHLKSVCSLQKRIICQKSQRHNMTNPPNGNVDRCMSQRVQSTASKLIQCIITISPQMIKWVLQSSWAGRKSALILLVLSELTETRISKRSELNSHHRKVKLPRQMIILKKRIIFGPRERQIPVFSNVFSMPSDASTKKRRCKRLCVFVAYWFKLSMYTPRRTELINLLKRVAGWS